MKKQRILILTFILCAVSANAQWSAGISAGWDYNWPSINKGYATDVVYKGQSGFDAGVIGRYQFKDWFAVRADLILDSRCYKMERNYYRTRDVYTNHQDIYMHLPIVADFSFGGKRLRGHCYLGGYVGCWVSARRYGEAIQNSTESGELEIVTYSFDEKMEFDSRRDSRFNAGLTGGAGISYRINSTWELMVDAFLMRDLTTSNIVYMAANPRYNDTFRLNMCVMYNF